MPRVTPTPGPLWSNYRRFPTVFEVVIMLTGEKGGLHLVSGDVVVMYEYAIVAPEPEIFPDKNDDKFFEPYAEQNVLLDNKRGRKITLELARDKKGRSLGPKKALKRIIRREIDQKCRELLNLPEGATVEYHTQKDFRPPDENDINLNRLRVFARVPITEGENG